jgi:DNA-directed RNA polymerase specialized sigma subunit
MTDRDLVYLYRHENFEHARDILQEKYLEKIKNYFLQLKNSKFFYCPVEDEDIDSLAYIAFNNAIKTFNLKQYDYNFVQGLMTYCRSFILRHNYDSIGNRHRVLNSNLRIQQRIINCSSFDKYNGDDEINEGLTNQDKMKIVNDFAQRYTKLVKDIIDYRSQGYTNKEIAAITHISVNRIIYTFSTFVRNIREHVTKHNIF